MKRGIAALGVDEVEDLAHAVAELLRGRRRRALPRVEVLRTLCQVGLAEEAALAVLDLGLQRGLFAEIGSEIWALAEHAEAG